MTILYIFSGLPACGKTTLAKKLSQEIKATYIRIDTIEQGIRDLCNFNIQGEGYELAYRIIADNLILGNNVVADSCNPIKLTRNDYTRIAQKNNSKCINIEVICSDETEHIKRTETRDCDIKNLELPTWEDVKERAYDAWDTDRIIIDTAQKSIEESTAELLDKLKTISQQHRTI